MFASLPMYDFPGHRAHTDAFWAAVRDGLRARGVAAPEALTRDEGPAYDWLSPAMLLSQTCGLPFARRLRGRVALVAGVDHGLPDAPPGTYLSRVVVRGDDPAQSLSDLRGRVVAVNSGESQSGSGSLRALVAPLAGGTPFFGRVVETGAHALSLRAVAEGRADAAALDAVSFLMLARHAPEAARVRVIASTAPTPGLPFITAAGGPVEALRGALEDAVAGLSEAAREAMALRGLVARREADFDAISDADGRHPPLAAPSA